MPLTDSAMTYEGATQKQHGKGTVKKTFMVTEPCHLRRVKVCGQNVALVTICEEVVEVDYRYE